MIDIPDAIKALGAISFVVTPTIRIDSCYVVAGERSSNIKSTVSTIVGANSSFKCANRANIVALTIVLKSMSFAF